MKVENLRIGQLVYHSMFYNGKKQAKIVGITQSEVELQGDFEGGTYPIDGLSKKLHSKKVEYVELIRDKNILGYSPILIETGKKPKMFLDKEKMPVSFKTKKEAKNYVKNLIIQ
jgi:hypothetical protein